MDKLMTKYKPFFVTLAAIGILAIVLLSMAPLFGIY
jgi:hypothetical protein